MIIGSTLFGIFHLLTLQILVSFDPITARSTAHGLCVDRTFCYFVKPLLLFGGPDFFGPAIATCEGSVHVVRRTRVERTVRNLLRSIGLDGTVTDCVFMRRHLAATDESLFPAPRHTRAQLEAANYMLYRPKQPASEDKLVAFLRLEPKCFPTMLRNPRAISRSAIGRSVNVFSTDCSPSLNPSRFDAAASRSRSTLTFFK
jgi:hypothetical protein